MFHPHGWQSQDSPRFSSSEQNTNQSRSDSTRDSRSSSLSAGSEGGGGRGGNFNRIGTSDRQSSSQPGTSLFPQINHQSASFGASGSNGIGDDFFGMDLRAKSSASDIPDPSPYLGPETTAAAASGSQTSSIALDRQDIDGFSQPELFGFSGQAGEGHGKDHWLSSASPSNSTSDLSSHQKLNNLTDTTLGLSNSNSDSIYSRNNSLGFDANLGRDFGEVSSSGSDVDLLMPSPEMFSSSQASSSSSPSFGQWGLSGQLGSSQGEVAPQGYSSAGLTRLRRPSALKLEGNSPIAQDSESSSLPSSKLGRSESIGNVRGVTPIRSMEPQEPTSTGGAVVLTPQAKARYSTDFYPNSQSNSKEQKSQTSNEPSPLLVKSSSFSSHRLSPSFSEAGKFETSNFKPASSEMGDAGDPNHDFSSSRSQPSYGFSNSHFSFAAGSPQSSIGATSSQGSFQGGGGRQSQSRPPISPTSSMSTMSTAAAQSSPNLTLWGAFVNVNPPVGSNSRPSSSGLRSVASFTSSTGSGQTSASNSNSNSGSGVGAEANFSNSQRSSIASSIGGLGIGVSGQKTDLPPPMHRSHSSSASSWATDSSGSSDTSYQNLRPLHRDRSNSGPWKGSSQLGPRQSQDFSHHPLSLDVNMHMQRDSPRSTGGSLGASTGCYESSPNPATQFGSRGIQDFDMAYHEAHLSAALAANQINSSSRSRSPPPTQTGGSGSSHGHEGHRTPTIPEEEESGLLHQQEQLRAMKIARLQHQQQQQQLQHSKSHSRPASAGSNVSSNREPEHHLVTDPRTGSPSKQNSQINPQAGALRSIGQPHNRPFGRFLASLNFSTEGMSDCGPFIGSVVSEYLKTPSRLGMGERTVLIMTSRVAQKSYGTEKRFLCPPPMVMLVGASWWTALPDMVPSPNPSSSTLENPTVLAPPSLQISMTGESSVLDAPLEWTSSSGRPIENGNASAEIAISAKYIGKQLYITDVDDRKSVEALVHVSVPGTSTLDRHHLGSFASKPIKVISKPTKKRQAKGNADLCITHGSTVSLFHRMRSQTVSTKYLGVSDPPTWFKGSDGRSFNDPNSQANRSHPACFIAKTSAWQPFIIYRVDPTRVAEPNASSAHPPVEGYPPPPPNALPITSEAIPIKFNQPVVLQCLHTAVVSPTMIIRKIEKSNTAVGGGSFSSADVESWNYKEAFGDSVAQLNKIAFELVENPSSVMNIRPGSAQSSTEVDSSPGPSGPFLACLNDNVGMHKPANPRRWCSSRPSTPPTPMTPMTQDTEMSMNKSSSSHGLGGMNAFEGTPPTSPTSMAVAYAAAQTRLSMSQEGRHGNRPFSPFSSPSNESQLPPPSSDGGKVAKRPRRVSSLVGVQRGPPISSPSSSRGRKRGQSLSMVGMQNQMNMNQQQQQQQQQQPQQQIHRTSSFANSLSTSSSNASVSSPGSSWSVDVGDQDIWTIVNADIASHTFYVPPRLIGASQPQSAFFDSEAAHLISSPAPSRPIAPIPVVDLVIPPQPQPRMEGGGDAFAPPPCVTLIGENFTPQLFVFFGDYQSERVEVHSPETIACTPPPTHDADGNLKGRVPVLLVRHDGVIFPTKCFFP